VVAAKSAGCRYAYISFCDDKRFWLKSKYGYPATFTERPRELSLCPPTILQSDLLMIKDMSQHARYAHLPSVVNPPGTKFYCAMPLINAEGFALGTLCVWDPQPKELDPEQQECIRRLARPGDVGSKNEAVPTSTNLNQSSDCFPPYAHRTGGSAAGPSDKCEWSEAPVMSEVGSEGVAIEHACRGSQLVRVRP